MKYIFQAAVIMAVTLVGELLHLLIPLPIPASIYGLIIMLACLKLRVIKLEHVEGAGEFLLDIMPVLFIPVSVGLIATWAELRAMLVPVIVISLATTFIVMAATGWAAQIAIREGQRGRQ